MSKVIQTTQVVLFLLILIPIHAQDTYQDWLKKQSAGFQSYQELEDQQFSAFLKAEWERLDAYNGIVPDKTPKPVKVPTYKPPEDKPQPLPTTHPVTPPDIPKPGPAPRASRIKAAKAPEVNNSLSLIVPFLGMQLGFQIDSEMARVQRGTMDKQFVSDYWENITATEYGGTTTAPTTVIDSASSVTDTTRTFSELVNGTTYFYRVTAVDIAGNESAYSSEINATPSAITALIDREGTPGGFALHNNYPNPFNPVTTVRFDMPEQAEVRLIVYDIMGREVAQLMSGLLSAGYHKVVWAGLDAFGRPVPSGTYIARLVTPDYTKSIKMVLLK